ncbi:MGMT family protein, partial [Streptobacillus moniliformis]|uniref:MGMT family protein n=1 Tax=Streptobacillus moniliformis TaxID=34105 RepID=UPI0039C410B9
MSNIEVGENKIILETINWLKRYFLGENPTINTNILLPEATEFRKKVFEVLLSIPYGKTMSYKEVSDKLNEKYGIKSSARA